MSVNKDYSHSWVRISHGLKKLVTNLNNKDQDNNNEQATSETKSEEFKLKTNVLAFASRSKAKAKPQELPIWKRTWTDVEPGEYSLSDYPVSKKLTNLLRHGSLPQEDDGAIEFWRLTDYLQNHFVHSRHWSDEKWKSSMAGGRGNKKRLQYCTDSSGEIFTSKPFKAIWDAIPLIQNCRTMCLFRTISSSSFITLDVQSMYRPSQIQD